MLGIFLVLLVVLWQFLWKPYLQVRDERVARVEGARAKAGAARRRVRGTASRASRAPWPRRAARGNVETAKLRLEAQAREQQDRRRGSGGRPQDDGRGARGA